MPFAANNACAGRKQRMSARELKARQIQRRAAQKAAEAARRDSSDSFQVYNEGVSESRKRKLTSGRLSVLGNSTNKSHINSPKRKRSLNSNSIGQFPCRTPETKRI